MNNGKKELMNGSKTMNNGKKDLMYGSKTGLMYE